MNGRTNSSDVTIQEINYGALIPLEAPTNLVLTPLNARVDITWTDPVDKVASPGGEDVALWDRTVIIRKAGSAPTGPDDGEIIYTETTRNQHQYDVYSDTNNVVNNTVYYYAVYAYTQMDVPSEAISGNCKPIAGTPVFKQTLEEINDADATASIDNYAVFSGDGHVFNYNDSLTRGSMEGLYVGGINYADMAATANMVFIAGGERVYRVAGSTYYEYYNNVFAYNKSFVRMQAEEGLPTKRCPGTGIAFKNYAIFAGGSYSPQRGGSTTKTSETTCYDESLTRISISNVTNSGDALSATALSDYVLIGGGSSAAMDAYDSSLTKSRPTSLSESKYGVAAVTNDDNKAAFIGGKLNSYSGGTYGGESYTTDIYDASLTRSSGPVIPNNRMLRCDTWLQGHVRCGAYLVLPLYFTGNEGHPTGLYQFDLSFTTQPVVIPGIEVSFDLVMVSGKAGKYALLLSSDSTNQFIVLEAA